MEVVGQPCLDVECQGGAHIFAEFVQKGNLEVHSDLTATQHTKLLPSITACN